VIAHENVENVGQADARKRQIDGVQRIVHDHWTVRFDLYVASLILQVPAIESVIVGATRLSQLEDNVKALEFSVPAELVARLDAVSASETRFPYMFFGDAMQSMLHGRHSVSDKPEGYVLRTTLMGQAASVGAV
jgi:hypothetical protein